MFSTEHGIRRNTSLTVRSRPLKLASSETANMRSHLADEGLSLNPRQWFTGQT
jgi:hypothetical protein